MVKQLGQKMAEFGFRYEDYRRREWRYFLSEKNFQTKTFPISLKASGGVYIGILIFLRRFVYLNTVMMVLK
jgi:hypothetical protein